MSVSRRATFGEDAELYDRARPGYPQALFDDLVRETGVSSRDRILEIGCGTGQATVPLAQRGLAIDALELSPTLAELARHNVRAHPRVSVRVGAFEDLPDPHPAFDLVLAASSFHWVDPGVRMEKVARAVRPGGHLALVNTHHVRGGTVAFFEGSQRCYREFFPATAPGWRLLTIEEVEATRTEVDDGGFFRQVFRRTYPWDLRYSRSAYLDLLRTYSDHRSLGPVRREELLACLGDLIDTEFHGVVQKAHLSELVLARRTGGGS